MMLFKTQKVLLSDMILCLSRVMEWICPKIVNHQMRVAYIAQSIAAEIGLSNEQQNQLVLAGVLHDIGAFSLKELAHLEDYETNPAHVEAHAELGYLLLRNFKPFRQVAELIRLHHIPWENGMGMDPEASATPHLSQIIFLAGKIDALIRSDTEILGQVPDICRKIREAAGALFVPEYVDAFLSLAEKEYFWFSIDSSSINQTVVESLRFVNIELDIDNMINLSKVFSHMIDFRCRFTATHSSGVAGTAEVLSQLYSFSESGSQMMKVAGYLHDIGKLSIPVEILHKPDRLTAEEFNIVKKHPFWTYQALGSINGLEEISTWASFHHERIDSTGYPFRYKGGELPLGSRIIAVADVFTALTEDRPYRKGMEQEKVRDILRGMVTDRALDAGVVSTLISHYDHIDSCRMASQVESARLYGEFDNAVNFGSPSGGSAICPQSALGG